MKDVNENKKVRKRITLKEYFNGLKTHQKILLVTTHLFGFAQLLFSVFVYYANVYSLMQMKVDYNLNLQDTIIKFLELIINYWYCTILPPVVIILDIIFLKKRKFSYIVCAVNVVIIFFNYVLALSYAWHWA